jgi:plastocyanin
VDVSVGGALGTEASMKKVLLGLGLGFSIALVPACSSDDTSSSSGDGGTAAAAATVTVSSNQFTPPSVTIKKGEIVRFQWSPGGQHNVVSGKSCTADNKFRSGDPQGGGSWDKKFEEAGTFEYFCEPHCSSFGMKGTVVVQ